jgi:NAD(P)-dependent dehydrogenase (short-subunit alcohol dehydrogenase family)
LRADLGERVVFQSVDVTNEKAVAQAISEVVRVRGRLDVLVNSAGITGKTNMKSQVVDLEDFQKVLQVNLLGPFLTAKHALPRMVQRGFGRILPIASIAGKDGNAGMPAYSASKAAVIAMTKVQGKEYAETGVTAMRTRSRPCRRNRRMAV